MASAKRKRSECSSASRKRFQIKEPSLITKSEEGTLAAVFGSTVETQGAIIPLGVAHPEVLGSGTETPMLIDADVPPANKVPPSIARALSISTVAHP